MGSVFELAKVELKNITKKFGDFIAVDNLNLEVEDKSIVCLLGPSGCGKTTTLRMIAGLETPTQGDIYIGDKRANNLSPQERDISMVFQFYAIYPGVTVFKNMAMPLQALRMSKSDVKSKVSEIAEMLGINDILDNKVDGLDISQKQRVALGRSMVRDPAVFLLDEPLTNLDARVRATMRGEIKHLLKEIKATAIYVTHDHLEAITLADMIGVMNYAVLLQFDHTNMIYDKPSDMFVASFIGRPPMNMIDCSLDEKNGKFALDCSGFTIDIAQDIGGLIKEKATGSELVIGIRPEHLNITEKKQKDTIGTKVRVVEFLGDRAILDVDAGGVNMQTIASRELGRAKILQLTPGMNLLINPNKEKLHVFDKKTEKAII
jgi:multiple sugar transport system ATP-binding protein